MGMIRELEVSLSQMQTAVRVCRAWGIAGQTFLRWRRDEGGLR
jgi:hypothetical protein